MLFSLFVQVESQQFLGPGDMGTELVTGLPMQMKLVPYKKPFSMISTRLTNFNFNTYIQLAPGDS